MKATHVPKVDLDPSCTPAHDCALDLTPEAVSSACSKAPGTLGSSRMRKEERSALPRSLDLRGRDREEGMDDGCGWGPEDLGIH
jgi:hypothetical protein